MITYLIQTERTQEWFVMANNRKLKKILSKMLLVCGRNLNKDYCFLMSKANNTKIKSYKGFDIHKFNIIIKNNIYLTELRVDDLIFE